MEWLYSFFKKYFYKNNVLFKNSDRNLWLKISSTKNYLTILQKASKIAHFPYTKEKGQDASFFKSMIK